MKEKYLVSVGFYTCYNIEMDASSAEEAERLVKEQYDNGGVRYLTENGEDCSSYGETLIQCEGEA